MIHWAFDYIGKKWKIGGRGPEEFDCWGLVFFVYKTHLNIELPEYPGIDANDKLKVTRMITNGSGLQSWKILPDNMWDEFSVIAMSKRSKVFHHVGLYTKADGGLIIHASDNGRVIASRTSALRQAGWSIIKGFAYNA